MWSCGLLSLACDVWKRQASLGDKLRTQLKVSADDGLQIRGDGPMTDCMEKNLISKDLSDSVTSRPNPGFIC